MKFKAPPVEIPAVDPFQNDALNRKDSAEILTQFVSHASTPFVLSIDSPWGTGKTTFLAMWVHVLQKAGFRYLFYNAWESDFSDSPLVSLIGEVGSSLKHLALTGEKKTKASAAYEKTKKIGASLLKAALPTAVKLATSGLLDLEKVDTKDLADLAEDLAKKQIEKYQHDKDSIEGFRKSLSSFVATISELESGVSPKPVVFIIDELDRCRPDYAIQLLEKIKHLFNVPGLIFVLAMDIQQLGESVKAVYGGGINADGYLRRFIDLHYQLPAPEAGSFVRSLFARFELSGAFKLRDHRLNYEADQLQEALSRLFPLFDFSLRTQEQCFTSIAVAIRTTPPNGNLYPYHLGLLICLRAANKLLYNDYVKGEATPKNVLDYLRTLPGGTLLRTDDFEIITEANLVVGIRDQEKRRTAQHEYYAAAKDDQPDSSTKERAKWVVRAFEGVGSRSSDMTGYIHKKIEIAHQFVESPKPQ